MKTRRLGEGTDRFVPLPGKPLEERHLVDAVNYAAYVVVRYGEKYAPAFEVVERELAEFRAKRSPLDRARRIMELQTIDAEGLKAIC